MPAKLLLQAMSHWKNLQRWSHWALKVQILKEVWTLTPTHGQKKKKKTENFWEFQNFKVYRGCLVPMGFWGPLIPVQVGFLVAQARLFWFCLPPPGFLTFWLRVGQSLNMQPAITKYLGIKNTVFFRDEMPIYVTNGASDGYLGTALHYLQGTAAAKEGRKETGICRTRAILSHSFASPLKHK